MHTHVITSDNVNRALHDGLWWLKTAGLPTDSRNGRVMVAPGPVVTQYTFPDERILWEPRRDANPVFHLLEATWMLAGSNDAAQLLPFNSRMGEYAEDDLTMHGAYGHRWRRHFKVDQILAAVKELRARPDSRRCVIGMWDPATDLADKRDIPCNTHVYLANAKGQLNMTVCCRSNDIVWGAYGANAVHFSILQELIARELEISMGIYYQFSNNFHLYLDTPGMLDLLDNPPPCVDYYSHTGAARVLPVTVSRLLHPGERLTHFLDDCETFWGSLAVGVAPTLHEPKTQFFAEVVRPLARAYIFRKQGHPQWRAIVANMEASDWKLAFQLWCTRRNKDD